MDSSPFTGGLAYDEVGMTWADLTPDQRAGMSEAYWDQLSEANRRAFLERNCVNGDGHPRAYGSPYCLDCLKEQNE
jgi:hypothetical protein